MARNEETLHVDSHPTTRNAAHLTRRSFIKATTAATALAAASSLTACAPATSDLAATGEDAEAAHPVGRDIVSGEWKTAACWHNCGGRCLNKVLVQDGVVVRQKTDDTHEDSPDYPQQRGCLRGRSQRKQVFAEDRIKYPLKRAGWSLDAPNGELRGKDEWERVSWDEALDLVAQGLTRAKEQYGNRSILLLKGWNPEMTRTMGAFGGFTNFWDTNSYGSWSKTPFVIGFHHDNMQDQTINDRYDLRNCETIVMMAMNPAWSAAGSQMWNYWQAKAAGAKFIVVDPMYSETAATLDAEWIPIRPATDMAFLLGVAYAMLEADEAEGLIDWDFLNRCTVGFDAEHMPSDAKQQTNFKDYVQGAYDNTPKTPEWASEICGASPEAIRNLARAMGKDHKVGFLVSAASARVNNTDNLPQLVMTVGAMGGHMGKSGHMTGSTMHVTSGNGGPALIKAGKDGLPEIKNPVDDHINGNEVWDAVIDGTYTFTGTKHYDPAEKRDIDIHVIYHSSGNKLQTNVGMARAIEAHRKVDMVVAHAQFFTSAARYADIILPLTTEWERFDGLFGGTLGHKSNREMMVAYQQIIDPLYEAKSDQDIACELAEKLGIARADVYPFDVKQQYFNQLASMEVCDEDGKTYVPAVGITQEDIDELGVEGEPQEGKLAYQELKQLGVYQVKRTPDDNYGYIAFKDFVEDPEANPLETPSGKLEIYSQTLADTFSAMGWDTVTPIPTYVKVTNGYEDASASGAEYPLQVMNPHYLRRAHSVFDNIGWLREAWTNPVFISTADAEAAGVSDGDTVLVSSPYGQCVRDACVYAGLMPGVVALPHGAWVAVDEETGIDAAGADNYLTGPAPNGQGVSGYNSALCKIEKYTGEALAPDAEQPLRIVCKDGE